MLEIINPYIFEDILEFKKLDLLGYPWYLYYERYIVRIAREIEIIFTNNIYNEVKNVDRYNFF